MRFEASDGEVRIIKPGVERVGERQGLHWASALVGIPGTVFLVCAWADIVSRSLTPNLGVGMALSLISAWAFWKSEHLEDVVWTLALNHEKKTVELRGRFVARFGEVRVVRCDTDADLCHSLTLVVHSGQRFYDVPLCREKGTLHDREVFEQAASRIAKMLGVRAEMRTASAQNMSRAVRRGMP